MTDREKIRAEIERLKDEGGIGLNEYDMGYENGKGELCNHLLSFIDSLPEEKCEESSTIPEICKENGVSFPYPVVDFVAGQVFSEPPYFKYILSTGAIPEWLRAGDKVKIIILKDDENTENK